MCAARAASKRQAYLTLALLMGPLPLNAESNWCAAPKLCSQTFSIAHVHLTPFPIQANASHCSYGGQSVACLNQITRDAQTAYWHTVC